MADRTIGRFAGFAGDFRAVADEIGFVVDHEEGVAGELLGECGFFLDAVVVPDPETGGGGEFFEFLQGVVERLRVAAFEIGAAGAVDEQGVAGDEVLPDVVANAARRVAGSGDDADGGLGEGDFVAIRDEDGIFGAARPMRIFGFGYEEGDAVVVELFHGVDVVGVAVGDEDAGEGEAFFVQHFLNAVGVPGGIDDHGFVVVAVGDDVDEIVVVFDHELDDVVSHEIVLIALFS